MNDKVVRLPLGKTMYSTFHDEGTGGVALVDNPSIYNWYLNEVMNITCIRGFVNTYTSPLVRIVGSSIWDNPYLDRIHYLIKFDEKNVHRKIKRLLDKGYYVYFSGIDDFYMPGKSWYQERHFDHDGMIFGYNDTNKTYDIYAYNQSWLYTSFTIPQRSFVQSLHSKHHYVEYATLNGVKPKKEQVELDIPKIKKGLNEYLDSSWYKYPPNIDEPVYGIVVHDYLSMYMYKLLSNAFPHERIDRRVYRAIWEHKNVMLQRIEAVEAKLGMTNEISTQYKAVEKEANLMRMMYASYVIKPKYSVMETLRNKIVILRETEEKLLSTFLDSLEEY